MKRQRILFGLMAVLLGLSVLVVPSIALAAPPPTIYVVTNTEDYGSSDPVISGSLRWAMTQANTDGNNSRITFNIDTATDPNCDFGGPCTITPVRALPFLVAGGTEIDGYTQPGAAEAVGSGFATIQIEINGIYVTGNNGFNVTSADNVIRGLVINRFGYWGVAIYNPAADNNVIAGNYIGTDTTGLVCSTMGNGYSGVGMENGAQDNIIGGTTSADRNIISCNHLNGVDISDLANSGSTSGNQVLGNIIGDPDLGGTDQGNNGAGVFIGHGAFDNTVGGSIPGARNTINHNNGDGVQLYGPNTTGNVIAGNYIGVNGDATIEMRNLNAGVNILGGAHGNTVGGSTAAERNVISGNMNSGVRIAGPATHDNTVSGNYLGTNASGSAAISNAISGVLIEDEAYNNTIGPLNLISGNNGPGVLIKGDATLNFVVTNYIGTNASLTAAVMNTYGVRMEGGASYNIIGGISLGDANLISGNEFEGIVISGLGTDFNAVLSNTIGTNYPASAALPNDTGVRIDAGAQSNYIGYPGSANLISGNSSNGVVINGLNTNANAVSGNVIGLNGSGALALPNMGDGVLISGGAQENVIGGSSTGAGNVISGNGDYGVMLQGADTMHNTVSGNYIGVNPAGTSAIPNQESGVYLRDGAFYNTIGGETESERNIISGNGQYGILMVDTGTEQNRIAGNYIGTDATGSSAIPNEVGGISLQNGSAYNTIGGANPGEGNLISGNDGQGIYLVQAGTDNNTISGNIIGLNADGNAVLPNSRNGILLQLSANSNVIGGPTAAERNLISGNAERGIRISTCSDTEILGNYVGTSMDGLMALGNTYEGIQLVNNTTNTTIGPGNFILFNGFSGVSATGVGSTGNVITRNPVHGNGSDEIILVDGANGGILPPDITAVTLAPITISGTACAGCTVEVFANPVDEEEGWTYLGSATAGGGGNWNLAVSSIPAPYLTATATDASDGTSMFSNTYLSDVLSLFLPLIAR